MSERAWDVFRAVARTLSLACLVLFILWVGQLALHIATGVPIVLR